VPITTLDERTALILIDFQHGILRLPLLHDRALLLSNAKRLVEGFHAAELPVVFLRVNDLRPTRTDEPPPSGSVPTPDYDQFTDELSPSAQDVVVTKHGWDAFYATDLDLRLRRRAVTQVVFAGIAASRGVESSARSAQVRAYNVAFAVDAISDIHQPSFDHSTRVMFPRLGQVGTTETVVAALRR
jgi:nicotinamidase-related amidase